MGLGFPCSEHIGQRLSASPPIGDGFVVGAGVAVFGTFLARSLIAVNSAKYISSLYFSPFRDMNKSMLFIGLAQAVKILSLTGKQACFIAQFLGVSFMNTTALATSND
jgi:hypothetical protein